MKNHEWVFLTDVDGTLIYKCGNIGQTIIDSAEAYIAAGGGLGLATGRSILSSREIATILRVNIPSIVFGGAMIYDFGRESTLWTCHLSEKTMNIVEDIARKFKDVALIIYTDSSISIINANSILWRSGVPDETRTEFVSKSIAGGILKINLCGEPEQLRLIMDTYFPENEYGVTFSGAHYAEIVSVRAGKGKALEALSRIINISPDRVFVMGDAHNDLDMMRRARYRFTLENASDNIKQEADIVFPHCSDQGAAEGFLRAKEILVKADRVF